MSLPAPKAVYESSSPKEQVARPQILLADDCEATRDVIKLILDAEYEVITCNNGRVAWERIEQDENVRALVTDITMPELDGVELTERIRKSDNPRIKDIPVIVMTGGADKDVRRRAFVS